MWVPGLYLLYSIVSLAASKVDSRYKPTIFKFRMACLVMLLIIQLLLFALPIGGLIGFVLSVAALSAPIYFVESHIRGELNRRGALTGGRRSLP